MTNYENLTPPTRGQKVVIDDSIFQEILLIADKYNVLDISKLNAAYLSDQSSINNKTFTYNLEIQMEVAKFLKCPEFGTDIIENM